MELKNFIVLDDDYISSLLNERALIDIADKERIRFFSDAVECLHYIRMTWRSTDGLTCILLDINMPKLNGWEFLDELERLPEELQNRYGIIIVTSSFDPRDRAESDRHPMVRGYLTKPITTNDLKALLQGPTQPVSA